MAVNEKEYKYSDITRRVIDAAMRVHSTLGNDFQEVIYQRALAIELTKQDLPFQRELEMQIYYDSHDIGTRRVDFLVDGKIMVELKAVSKLEETHLAQAINYLEAYRLEDRPTNQLWRQEPGVPSRHQQQTFGSSSQNAICVIS